MAQSIERFSSRVANYVRYRPGYPPAIIDLLKTECGLTSESLIADIGSGSGKLTELFLENGNGVFGVEPNAAMRVAAEEILQAYSGFISVDGTAESTTLISASVDFVIAGQAFHWFDVTKAKAEARRILKPGGWAVLVWNERQVDTTPFLHDYEQFLLQYGSDYPVVRHENAVAAIGDFFAPENVRLESYPNSQEFDFESLKGRLLSTSYIPELGHPNFDSMLRDLGDIFNKYEKDGRISFDYDTRAYYGRLSNNSEPEQTS
jgi:SAM-dependent methyltransferase